MATRKGDITICICQNNDQKKLIIETVDSNIENIIGYESEELVGKTLDQILLPSVNEIVNSHLDYTEKGEDLADVLTKVRDFGFTTKLGYEVKLNMRINRTVTDDEYPRFELIIKDHSEVSEGSKSALRNFRGRQVIDKDTGLPQKESFMKEAEFINFCVSKERIAASLAVISIDGLDNFRTQYGESITKEMISELVARCRLNFRDDDILGSLGENIIGVILLEANPAIAKNPLNRLRWQIASQPFTIADGEEASITLSIAYSGITKGRLVDSAIKLCQEKLEELRKSGGNRIAEVV